MGVYFRDEFFAIREYDFFFVFVVLELVAIFSGYVLFFSIVAFYHQIMQLWSLRLIHRHYQVRLSLLFSSFISRLQLLHYPCSIILCFCTLTHLHLVLCLESWVLSCALCPTHGLIQKLVKSDWCWCCAYVRFHLNHPIDPWWRWILLLISFGMIVGEASWDALL